MIVKNTNPHKQTICTSCRKNIEYNQRYFTLPSSFQKYCLQCAPKEIPKMIELLNRDLKTIEEQ